MGASTLADTAVQRFYRYHSHVYDATRWTILHGRKRAIADMNIQPDSHVMEVGCGTGLNFRHIESYLDQDRGRLVGVDLSEHMLVKAEGRVSSSGWTNIELMAADATKLDLGRQFDAVLFGYSLTMIPDWEASLEQAVEHLKPGGRLVVLDFSTFDSWGPLAPVMRGWLRANHVETKNPYLDGIRRLFPDVEIRRWLGGYNFTARATKPS